MYAQLGNTVFDGLKSFVSFSQDGDVVLVEHALIGRKPRLQPSGLNLETITLSLFLHQEYCNVELEIAKLISSRDAFEILPLLWGNGKIEGNFVIKQLTRDKVQQDELGNTYASVVTVILKECINDNRLDQAQQDAQKNAFAVNKKPSTKSSRSNVTTCPQQISLSITRIRSAGGMINSLIAAFDRSGKVIVLCEKINNDCILLIDSTNTAGSCIFNNIDIRTAANNVKSEASDLIRSAANFQISMIDEKDNNILLQAGISSLVKAASPIVSKAIVPS